jgi:glyoxylate/hydroxypyruvate reductase A
MRAAQRLKDNGFQVSGWSRSAKQIDEIETFSGDTGLQDILQQSDILLCLLPLTASTRALLNAERLALLPRGASVINFARGPIIESQALVNSLDRGHLKHAVLDVFDQEPLPRENPLWAHSAITILPHISAPTTMESATKIVAKNIGCYRQTGELPTAVDISRGY